MAAKSVLSLVPGFVLSRPNPSIGFGTGGTVKSSQFCPGTSRDKPGTGPGQDKKACMHDKRPCTAVHSTMQAGYELNECTDARREIAEYLAHSQTFGGDILAGKNMITQCLLDSNRSGNGTTAARNVARNDGE
jgi:hypothetical protein